MKQELGGEYTNSDIERFRMIGNMCTGRVLDIGAGDGYMIEFLHDSCNLYKAIDPEPTARSVRGDIYTMDLNTTYDTVLLLEVLEHLERPPEALQRIRRVVADNGKLIISVPNPYNLDQIASVLHNNTNITNPNHITMFGDNEITSLCTHAGFSRVHPIRFYTKIPGINWLSPFKTRWGEWNIYEVRI